MAELRKRQRPKLESWRSKLGILFLELEHLSKLHSIAAALTNRRRDMGAGLTGLEHVDLLISRVAKELAQCAGNERIWAMLEASRSLARTDLDKEGTDAGT